MNTLDLELPNFSEHPPAPEMSCAEYQREMTTEKLLDDFLRNEGRQTEEWPDFGAA